MLILRILGSLCLFNKFAGAVKIALFNQFSLASC